MTAKRRRTIFGVGALVAALYALWRLLEARRREPAGTPGLSWQSQPFPLPPRPVPVPDVAPPVDSTAEPEAAWVEPVDGACPATHPVKGKLASGIFHAPGGQMYERTHADRCYADAEAAESDGLRASKR